MARDDPDKRRANVRARLQRLRGERRRIAVRALVSEEAEALEGDWPSWAHDGQTAPPQCPDGSDWRTWVIMAGRGFGKTLAGSQWILEAVRTSANPFVPSEVEERVSTSLDTSGVGGAIRTNGIGDGPLRIALVGATLDDARRVMIEGKSGLLTVADGWITDWHPSRRLLRFTTGAEATLFSGASPEALRGPEHHFAWCDELAKWEKAGECWDMLQLGLRLGAYPRALVTTTPKPGPALKRIMAAPGTIVTGGPTRANPHLPRAFKETVEELYAGTRLGRQELEGELLTDAAGALWTVEVIEGSRLSPLPQAGDEEPQRGEGVGQLRLAPRPSRTGPPPAPPACGRGVTTVIGVDPPSGDGTCGIIACARDKGGFGHVLADHSVTACSPERWARAVADAAAIHGAHLVVAERNQGGRMVESVLRAADPRLRLKLVHASDGKSARAEPIALLFEAGRVRLHGRFPELEAELLGLIAGGDYEGPGVSPDRADAMVWALTELMLGKERAPPKVRGF